MMFVTLSHCFRSASKMNLCDPDNRQLTFVDNSDKKKALNLNRFCAVLTTNVPCY